MQDQRLRHAKFRSKSFISFICFKAITKKLINMKLFKKFCSVIITFLQNYVTILSISLVASFERCSVIVFLYFSMLTYINISQSLHVECQTTALCRNKSLPTILKSLQSILYTTAFSFRGGIGILLSLSLC